jgi:hypothetical protein
MLKKGEADNLIMLPLGAGLTRFEGDIIYIQRNRGRRGGRKEQDIKHISFIYIFKVT